jgi:hypothetical protein
MILTGCNRPAVAALPEEPPTILGFTVEITELIFRGLLQFFRTFLNAIGFSV